ncbi:MAG TPA: hypothetical protein VKA15_14975 [Isosphaeraceae bacterium]|nr:hypothetical protein [Isosphaeraceae bacterium]
MMPTNLRELVAYLEERPRVRITGPSPHSLEPVMREELYLYWADGLMWFQPFDGPPCHIFVGCKLKAAAGSATGLAFDAEGFTVTKFGVSIRVEYLPD